MLVIVKSNLGSQIIQIINLHQFAVLGLWVANCELFELLDVRLFVTVFCGRRSNYCLNAIPTWNCKSAPGKQRLA